MDYLLDTNACIELIKGSRPVFRTRFQRALDRGARVYVSVVVAFELWYGVGKSGRPESNAKRVAAFFAGPVISLPFDDEDARQAGHVRAALELSGQPIGAYDVLIAGQALRRGFTLITANVREFRRVKDLRWEDWAV
ncbi:MAG: type II toxin-antitoxin system VapC family toxin [Candidatus Acidiferrales bacterium]